MEEEYKLWLIREEEKIMLRWASSQKIIRCISDEEVNISWKERTRRMIGSHKEELKEDEYEAWKAQMEDGERVRKILLNCSTWAWSLPGKCQGCEHHSGRTDGEIEETWRKMDANLKKRVERRGDTVQGVLQRHDEKRATLRKGACPRL
jgi:hypothetical protein